MRMEREAGSLYPHISGCSHITLGIELTDISVSLMSRLLFTRHVSNRLAGYKRISRVAGCLKWDLLGGRRLYSRISGQSPGNLRLFSLPFTRSRHGSLCIYITSVGMLGKA